MCRRFLSFLLFSVLITNCFAQKIEFEDNLTTTFEKANQQNKVVFIEYYNEKCPICKSIEPFFIDKEMGEFYNHNFINYRINTAQKKSTDSLFLEKTKLKFDGYPFFLFFDKEQKFLHFSGAKPNLEYLLQIGKTALNPSERTGSLEEKYNNGDRSIKTLYAYSQLVQLYKNQELLDEIANQLFISFPKEQLSSQKSYLILKNAVFDLDNGFFQYWINNLNLLINFEKDSKKGTEINVVQQIIFNAINSEQRKKWSLEKIIKVKDYALKSGLTKDPEGYFWEQEIALLLEKNKQEAAFLLFQNRVNNAKTNYDKLSKIHQSITLFAKSKYLDEVKKQLDNCFKTFIDLNEKAEVLYELAYFDFVTNNKIHFKISSQNAIAFYSKNKINPENLNKLIEKFSVNE